jgi:hypothetical protein
MCGKRGETQGEEGRLKTPEWSGTISIILGMDIIMQTRRIESVRLRDREMGMLSMMTDMVV